MKKNFIYTVAFLLSGAVLFSSCDDMLNVESNRVEYEFDDWTLNDSVYSVLGILKGVQQVGDRQVLINELRADLISLNKSKAVIDVQELSRSEFNLASNKYLDVKDYYAIINNCNIYFKRVESIKEDTLYRKFIMPEYVAVKAVRAWTYLQLAINHEYVPYFTEPILTHSAAEEVMNKPMLSRDEILAKLIEELLPYENPALFPMPAWDADGMALKFAYKNSSVDFETKKAFVPVRMLLGDMYLWRGEYKNAAKCYYDLLTGAGTGSTAPQYHDHSFKSGYTEAGGKNPGNGFGRMFAVSQFADVIARHVLAMIPYPNSALHGTTSQLADVFLPVGDRGGSQVVASPAIVSLSARQVFRYAEGQDLAKPDKYEYSNDKRYDTPGDLRLYSSTCKQISDDEAKTQYKNLIAKFNLDQNMTGAMYVPEIPTTYIVLNRPEQAYLRFAEALMGMEREGYEGAMEVAMDVLKVGVKDVYSLYKNPVYGERYLINAKGDTVKIYDIDKETNDTLGFTYRTVPYVASYDDSLAYDFSAAAFDENIGIHSRGSGDSERNIYYALDDINVARYFGKTITEGDVEIVNPATPVTHEDSVLYVSELILDEMALELAWEGTRFGDLVRVATALGDEDVLAKRIAGRDYVNTVSHRHPAFQYDGSVYTQMSNRANWYLPLPGKVVMPGKVEETPEGYDPAEDLE